MKSLSHVLFLVVSLLALGGCSKKESPGGADGAADDGSSAGDAGGGDSAGGGAIALDEKRFQAYVSYRKEYHLVLKTHMEGWQKLAKSVDERSTDLTKTVTAARGIQGLSEVQEAAMKSLRKKHGFSEEEDNRLWDAIGEVVAARASENPDMAPALQVYRDQQARGGEEKKVADEMLKSLMETEKEGLARAAEKYGPACVELLGKHLKELHELQKDNLRRVMEATGTPAK